MFNYSLFISLLQFVAIFSKTFKKSVSLRNSNLKFCVVIYTKDTHQIPKNRISVAESNNSLLSEEMYSELN